MRSDINHLPHAKQRELDRVVEMLFQGFRETVQNATGPRKSARILKIILFGSYARGTGSMRSPMPTSTNRITTFW
jgi:hypothetical protein